MIWKRISIFLLFFSGLLIAVFAGKNILPLYIVFWVCLIGIAQLYYRALPSDLPCLLEIPGICNKGDKITGYLHVIQTGKVPVFHGVAYIQINSLYYQQIQTISLDIMLMGGEEGIAAFDLNLPYTGMLEITLEKAEIFGIFGIGKKTITSDVKKYLSVMPDLRDMDVEIPHLGDDDPMGDEIREDIHGYDPAMYFGIHPYRMGDSIKNIHWKLTAKNDDIMVKEMGIPSGKEPRLWLNTGVYRLEPEVIDQLIEDYISLSMRLLKDGCRHILCWNDGDDNLQEYHVDNLTMLEENMDPVFHISFWENMKKDNIGIYIADYNGNYIYGYCHEDKDDYFVKIEEEMRLWNESGA